MSSKSLRKFVNLTPFVHFRSTQMGQYTEWIPKREDFQNQVGDGKVRTTLYKVRWEGYDKKVDTWEPITHLQGYATMVQLFKESHANDLEKLAADCQHEAEKKATDDLLHNKQTDPCHVGVRHATCTVPKCGFVIRYQNTSNLEQHYIRGGLDHKELAGRLAAMQQLERGVQLGAAADDSMTLSRTCKAPAFTAEKKARCDIKFVKWLVRKNRALTELYE